MDTVSIGKAGSRMGTGTMIVLDDRTCPVGFVHNLEKFFARESCGWCTPCREGLPFVEQTLQAIERGEGRSALQARRRQHVQVHVAVAKVAVGDRQRAGLAARDDRAGVPAAPLRAPAR